MFTIDPDSGVSLVAQIVAGVTHLVEEQSLRPGMKMPSIRQFANTHRVSLFTVVEAYDRLVAQGVLLSRPNAGFYVRRRSLARAGEDAATERTYQFDSSWYLRSIFENHRMEMRPGCGWLPSSWLFNEGLQRSLRRLASEATYSSGYGDPKGYLPLRKLVSQSIVNREIAANEDQVLLTQGSSQALDLVARRLVRAGDVVLVDNPGYANLMYVLRFIGATLVGIPRTPEGYDLAALEEAVCEHHPKVIFTQPRLQSPTGTSAQSGHLHRMLRLAEKHDMLIVENDIYADLDPEQRPSLASLDQISRVIHIGSFSKTLSPSLRVGFLVASTEMVGELAQFKMVAGLTSSEFGERIAYEAATDARWRRHIKSIKDRLTNEHERVADRLIDLGFELFAEAKSGLFLWAKHPACLDSRELSVRAAQQNILMGPGHLFSSDGAASPWLRFNVSYCDDERIFRFLAAEVESNFAHG
jgi:DNA-binding transcriptional MocR family regulator